MFGVKELLNKIIPEQPLSKVDKFKLLHTKAIDKRVLAYLVSILQNLHIEVLGRYQGTVLELMPYGNL